MVSKAPRAATMRVVSQTLPAFRGWTFAGYAHFRGCSGELYLAPRAYHSGDYARSIDWILKRFRQTHRGPMIAVGVSLGGNALPRWAQEPQARRPHKRSDAVASVSAPVDLAASGHAMGRGFNRQVYTRTRSCRP